jgi:hypothetical protein
MVEALMWQPLALAHLAAALAAVLMSYLCCHPVIAFVRRGWAIKRSEVVQSLSDAAKKIYLEQFLKQQTDNPADDFKKIYDTRYGPYRLIVPSILLALVLLPLTFLITERAVSALATTNGWTLTADGFPKLMILPGAAVAAIVGAYTWVVASLIGAAASHNLAPGVVLSSVLRLVVSVPMGYAIAYLAAKNLGPFIAFAIGAFPLNTVQLFFQRAAARQLSLDMPADERRDQVIQLSGVDPPTADRLREADITTIPQLAYCDPVQVSMRTNLGFQFVLDLVGQALAWIYFEQKLTALRLLGLRGGVEIRNLLENLQSGDQNEREAAQATFNAAAKAAGIDPVTAFHTVCSEIAHDPHTAFISEVWEDFVGDPDETPSEFVEGTSSGAEPAG